MSRTSSRRKKQMFPFGYLMIPLLGVVGVGLLFWGVKIFFLGEPKEPNKNQAGQEVVSVVALPTKTDKIENEELPSFDGVVAVPVAEGKRPQPSKPEKNPVSSKPQPTNAHQTPQPQPSRPTVAKPVPATSIPTGTDWLVQIGSFKQKSMAESLMKDVSSKGFRPMIREGNVDGVLYYRVLVPGGKSRADAQSLGEKLSSIGYPYFVLPGK